MLQVWVGPWRSLKDRHHLQRQGVLWIGGGWGGGVEQLLVLLCGLEPTPPTQDL